MDIEFDDAKDAANVEKHGVSLAFGAKVFNDSDYISISTIRVEDGERRFRAIGLIEGRLWTAVYVVRGSVNRFISVRKSNDREAREYDRP